MRLSIRKTCRAIGVLGLLTLFLTGCEMFKGRSEQYPKPSAANSTNSLALRPGDRVKVDFVGGGITIPPREEQVKEDGTINIEHIGAVEVVGKTARETEKLIQSKLVPDFYRSMTVTVTPLEQVYTVGGQVNRPGSQIYNGTTTVIKAIQSAGDFTDFANRRNIQITRSNGTIEFVDYEEATKRPSKNIEIFPHDSIIVDRRF